MFEGLLERILLSYFGEFFLNIDSKYLSVSLWNGKVNLNNLMINPAFLDKFKLPVKILKGLIKCVNIQLDWKSNFTTPTNITISGISLYLDIYPEDQWYPDDSILFPSKLALLKKYFIKQLEELEFNEQKKAEIQKNNTSGGFFNNYITKIIDNIQLNISDIEIIIIDKTTLGKEYAIGLTLQSLNIVTCNTQWEECFILRESEQKLFNKKLTLNEFGLYLSINLQFPKDNQHIDNVNDYITQKQFIIKPITLECKLTQNAGDISKDIDDFNIDKKYNANIALSNFEIEITKQQYDSIVHILEQISKYTKFRYCSYNRRKYLYFKPGAPGGEAIDNNNNNNKSTLQMFRYAVTILQKQIKYRKGKTNVFDIPKAFKKEYINEISNNFYTMFIKDINNKKQDINKTPLIMKEAIEFLDIEEIYAILNPIIAKVFNDKKEKSKGKSGGGFWGLFGKNKNNISSEAEAEKEAQIQKELEELTNILIKYQDSTSNENDILSYKFNINLDSCCVTFEDTNSKQSFLANLSAVKFCMNCYDVNKTLDLYVSQIGVIYNDNGDRKDIIINEHNNNNNKVNLIHFSFKSTFDNENLKDYKKIALLFGSVNIIYNKKFIFRLIKFFASNEYKNDLKNNVQLAKDMVYDTSSDYIKKKIQSDEELILDIISKPKKVYIPLTSSIEKDNLDKHSIIFNLGELKIYTPQQITTKTINQFTFVNKINIDLSQFNIILSEKQILNDVKVIVNIFQHPQVTSNFAVDIEIPNCAFVMNDVDLQILKNIGKYLLYTEKKSNKINRSTSSFEEYSKGSKLCVVVNKKISQGSYQTLYMVLNQQYLYFFNANKKGNYKEYYFLGTKTSISNVNEDKLSFDITENHIVMYTLHFNSKEEFNLSYKEINARIISENFFFENEKPKDKSNETDDNNKEEQTHQQLYINCVLTSLSIEISPTTQEQQLLITFNKSEVQFESINDDKTFNFKLEGISIINPTQHENDFYRKFIWCNNENNPQDKLIDVTITPTRKDSIEYKENNISLLINLQLGGIAVIFDPIQINFIINFLLSSSSQSESHESEKEIITFANCEEEKESIMLIGGLKNVNVIFILPNKGALFYELNINEAKFDVSIYKDHYNLKGSLKEFELSDLTGHPNTNIEPVKQNDNNVFKNKITIVSSKENTSALFDFAIVLYTEQCPLNVDNLSCDVNLTLNSLYLIYIQEQFMRFLNYLTREILGSLTYRQKEEELKRMTSAPQQQEIKYSNINTIDINNDNAKSESTELSLPEDNQSKIDDKKDMKLNMKISVINPQLIFKPTLLASKDQEFIIDFGNVEITNSYLPDNYKPNYKVQCFQISFTKAFIFTSSESYKLSNEFDGTIRIYMLDGINEYSISYIQIDWLLSEINIKLRLIDYINIMYCFYYNISYSDLLEDFMFLNFETYEQEAQRIQNLKSLIYTTNETTKFIFNLFIVNVTVSIQYDLSMNTFCYLQADNLLMNFCSLANEDGEIIIAIGNMSLYDSNKNQIISFKCEDTTVFTKCKQNIINKIQHEPLNVNQTKLDDILIKHFIFCKYIMKHTGNSEFHVNIQNINLIGRIDVFYLLYLFFLTKMPQNEIKQNDESNCIQEQDVNKRKVSKFLMFVNLTSSSICLINKDINPSQINMNLYCIGITINKLGLVYQNEDEAVIKNKMLTQKSTSTDMLTKITFYINGIDANISEIQSYINNNNKSNNQKLIKLGYLVLTTESTIQLSSIENKIFKNDNVYNLLNEEPIEVNFSNLDLKLILSIAQFAMDLLNEKHINTYFKNEPTNQAAVLYQHMLSNPNADINCCGIIKKRNIEALKLQTINATTTSFLGKETMTFTNGHTTSITLNNNGEDGSYKFFVLKINNVSLIYETNADKNPKAKRNACFCCELNCDASSFNYIANEWEPVIEIFDFLGQANVTPNKTEVFILSKEHTATNITISDLCVEFLYYNYTKWMNIINEFYSEKQKQLNESSYYDLFPSTTPSNHKILNYTGFDMKLIKNNKPYVDILSNTSYDIPFDESINNAIYSFEFKDFGFKGEAPQINLNLTNMAKYILLSKNNIHIPLYFSYLILNVLINKENKKLIYLYSPVTLTNFTKIPVEIKLHVNSNKHKDQKEKRDILIRLEPDDIIGIPPTHCNGSISIKPISFTEEKTFEFKKLFETNETIYETLNNNNNSFLVLSAIKSFDKDINKIELCITYTYTLYNFLPFDILFLPKQQKSTSSKKILIKKGEMCYIDQLPLSSNLEGEITIPTFDPPSKMNVVLYTAQTSKINNNNNNNVNSKDVIIYSSKEGIVKATSLVYDATKKIIVLYSPLVLINQTQISGSDIIFSYGAKKTNCNRIPTQKETTNIFLLNPDEPHLWISYDSMSSDKIITNQLCNVNDILLYPSSKKEEKYLSKMHKFILTSETSLLNKSFNLYSNVLTLKSYYFVINKTPFTIYIKYQDLSKHEHLKVFPSNQKEVFDFFGFGEEIKVYLQLYLVAKDNANKNDYTYDKSCKFKLKDPNVATISFNNLRDKNAQPYYMNIGRNIEDSSILLVFSETNELNAQILVNNKQTEKNVYVSIQGDAHETVNSRKKKCLTWREHCVSQVKKYIHIKTDDFAKADKGKHFIFEDDGTINSIKLPCTFSLNEVSDVSFSMTGISLVIVIKEQDKMDTTTTAPTSINEFIFKCDLSLLTISIVSDNRHVHKVIDYNAKYNRRELCLISIGDINLMYYNKKSNNNNLDEYELTFSTSFINIDNMSGPYVYYPVIFKAITDENKEEQNEDIPFLNVIIQCNKTTEDNILFVEQASFIIQQFEIKLDSDFCDLLYDLVMNLTIGTGMTMTTIHPIFLTEENFQKIMNQNKINCLIKGNSIHYKNYVNEEENPSSLFIKNIDISSLDFQFSFSCLTPSFFTKFINSGLISSSLLSSFSSVNKAHLTINGCIIDKPKSTLSDLFNAIFMHYKTYTVKIIFKLLTNTELLGSPNTLISGISQGVTDLYKQPKLGFKKGHLQGIFGIAKGSGKLIQNTFHGTFGFIDNLTSNISKGILSLGHDDEYMQKRARNQIKEKPNNVIKGLGYGFKSFSKGLIYGVSDIVRQPIKSLKEDKSIKGFGKGLLKGIGGMITKPVSGAIDLVSKTTEGIQNTVKKTETEEQIRDRRALYGKLKVIKVYNADHAIVVDKLSVAKKKIISCLQDEFVDVFDYTNNNKQMSYLIVTHTKLVSLNLDFTKIEEEIPVKDIKNIKKDNSTLIFEYKRAGISTIKTCETNEKLDWIIKKIKKCLHI